MRFKIQEFTYNEETGESTMMAVSEYGNLYSSVRCAEEDKDVQNQWDAYRFCEYKIAIQYLKYRCVYLRGRYKAVYDATNTVYNNISKNSFIDQKINLLYKIDAQAEGYEKIYKKTHQQYLNLKNNYKQYCSEWLENRRRLRKKVENMREE